MVVRSMSFGIRRPGFAPESASLGVQVRARLFIPRSLPISLSASGVENNLPRKVAVRIHGVITVVYKVLPEVTIVCLFHPSLLLSHCSHTADFVFLNVPSSCPP